MVTHFLDAWNDAAMRHAMVVHFPIVLSIVGIPVAVAAAVAARNARAMRWSALVLYVALALTGMLARNSGHDAEDAVHGSLDDDAQHLLEEHEELGHNLWMFGAAVAVLVGVSFANNRKLRLPSSWLAVAAALAAAGWIANTADHGGRLVYEHGAGTPDEIAELLGRDPSAEADADADADARITFFRQAVRPILVNRCYRCHNPRRAEKSGGLDQTAIAGLLAGGRSGPAIVPGRPDESLLIQAVRGTDPDLWMPPGDKKLSQEQIAALERWVAQGAAWEPLELQLPDD